MRSEAQYMRLREDKKSLPKFDFSNPELVQAELSTTQIQLEQIFKTGEYQRYSLEELRHLKRGARKFMRVANQNPDGVQRTGAYRNGTEGPLGKFVDDVLSPLEQGVNARLQELEGVNKPSLEVISGGAASTSSSEGDRMNLPEVEEDGELSHAIEVAGFILDTLKNRWDTRQELDQSEIRKFQRHEQEWERRIQETEDNEGASRLAALMAQIRQYMTYANIASASDRGRLADFAQQTTSRKPSMRRPVPKTRLVDRLRRWMDRP